MDALTRSCEVLSHLVYEPILTPIPTSAQFVAARAAMQATYAAAPAALAADSAPCPSCMPRSSMSHNPNWQSAVPSGVDEWAGEGYASAQGVSR